jgi:ubiquinone/menaquinone biosynthesis C-methylase UbiE
MSDRYSQEQVHRFWTEQAAAHGQSPSASWSDRMVIELEIREIVRHLSDGDRVLDVGCANGYSTVQFACQRRVRIRGLDYIPEMVAQARRRAASMASALVGQVEFDIGDATALGEPDDSYDKVTAIRVVINLGEWPRQQVALRECSRVVRPGGLLLLSEATVQGWQRLNTLRREWRLPDIPMPPFNQYLDQDAVVQALTPRLELVTIVDFASTYYVGTRLLKPLLIRALGADIDVADPEAEWNRWCAQLPPWGDYGTQKLFVFRKPGRA